MEFKSIHIYVSFIISDISERFNIPISELRDRYIEKRKRCEGVTAKGTACSNNALDGKKFCKCHLRVKTTGDKKTKEKRQKKRDTLIIHSHKPSECDDECEACKCFGNKRYTGVEIDSDILKRINEIVNS